tara:strand:- start:614 stop:1195 length:582 start_codon:yes stop_codon:yes gene_type:complete
MQELPRFPDQSSTVEQVEKWWEDFFEIIEERYDDCGLCDEESLLEEMRKIDDSVTEDDISEYTLEFHPEEIISAELMTTIESSLKGTCLRTDGPDYDCDSLQDASNGSEIFGFPAPPWTASLALIGPPLKGSTFEEVQEGPFWSAFDSSLDRLIEICEENGIRIVYPQNISIGTTLWAGEDLIGGIAFTLDED